MSATNRSCSFFGLFVAALFSCVLTQTAWADYPGYVTDADGRIVKSKDGKCVRTRNWTPEMIVPPECGGLEEPEVDKLQKISEPNSKMKYPMEKNKMKKILLLLICIMSVWYVFGCGSSNEKLYIYNWTYYTPDEFAKLVNEDWLRQIESEDPYLPILHINAEADGFDPLSKSLYSDYQTVVRFYFMRMNLIKYIGIEPRFPMLDESLIQYCAKIPSSMKIRGMSNTKYILKETMKDILPREIVFRKDKLGHSIPLKNWMRDDKRVRSFIMDSLSEQKIKRRGYFNEKAVLTLIRDHINKTKNNSHRLWALLVLELWLSEHFDNQT